MTKLTYGDLVPGTLCKSRDGSKTYLVLSVVQRSQGVEGVGIYVFRFLYVWHGVIDDINVIVDRPHERPANGGVRHQDYVYILPVITG